MSKIWNNEALVFTSFLLNPKHSFGIYAYYSCFLSKQEREEKKRGKKKKIERNLKKGFQIEGAKFTIS